KHLEEHLGKEMAYHMILLKKSFDSCTKTMKDEFETVLKVISTLGQALSGDLTSSLFVTQMKDDRIRQLEKALRVTGACLEPLSDFASSSSSSVPTLTCSRIHARRHEGGVEDQELQLRA